MPTQSNEARRPILVTGLHRTGTTWTGKLLASAPGLYYVHEPFHKEHAPGICPVRFERWFQHVGPHNKETFEAALARTVTLRFALGSHIVTALHPERSHFYDGLRGVGWAFREWYRWTWARFQGARPLIKDPLALLAAEWIADRFDAQVIVLVRHPAGFVRSIRELEWRHDFSDFTEQAGLSEGLLGPYADDIEDEAENPSSLLENASLLWKVMGAVIAKYRQRHPNWQIVRMEDLAMHPTDEFRDLWNYLDVPYDREMASAVREFTTAASSSEEDYGTHDVKRDSESQAWRWRSELEPGAVDRIRNATAPVWREFYEAGEWT
jgi:hypothetical protein